LYDPAADPVNLLSRLELRHFRRLTWRITTPIMPEMAEDWVRRVIDAITQRVQADLEAQFAEVGSRHQAQLESVRRDAEAAAEQRWAARVEEVRTEWAGRFESEVASVRADAERRMVGEGTRLRLEAEQAAQLAALAKQELGAAIDAERNRAFAELSAERQQHSNEREQLERQVDEFRRQLSAIEEQLAGVRAARTEAEEDARQEHQHATAADDARVAERQSQLVVVERLLSSVRALDASRSLSQVLTALLSAAAAEAPRVALFVMNGATLQPWKAEGFGPDWSLAEEGHESLLSEALRRAGPVATSERGPTPPRFANLPSDRAAIAVPLLVSAQPVAVLYADDASDDRPRAPASWPEAVQILCRHASAGLAHLTAARALEAMRRSAVRPVADAGTSDRTSAVSPEDSNSARRFARLLVSEIKLYNEPAVRIGRRNRDLLTRLKPEIDRARRLYEQRISSSVDSRGVLFQQELVQTLADGDPALLGGSS
jgi:hypothetical protein